MSHTRSPATLSSNFQLIIDNALDTGTYRKRTKLDLLTHPLALTTAKALAASFISFVTQQAQLSNIDTLAQGPGTEPMFIPTNPYIKACQAIQRKLFKQLSLAGENEVGKATQKLLESMQDIGPEAGGSLVHPAAPCPALVSSYCPQGSHRSRDSELTSFKSIVDVLSKMVRQTPIV
jgi:hypothetical protein